MKNKKGRLQDRRFFLSFLAGSVIQAIGRIKFEDSWRIGNQFEVGNSHQRLQNIPEINVIIILGERVDQVPLDVGKVPIGGVHLRCRQSLGGWGSKIGL